jgi:hypothetical protein
MWLTTAQVDGLVMIDSDAYYEQFVHRRPLLMDSKSDSRSWVSDCTCSVCSVRRGAGLEQSKAPFEDYTEYPRQTGVLDRALRMEQFLLLPKYVQAYVFRTRTWGESIQNLTIWLLIMYRDCECRQLERTYFRDRND